jgi:hypothetical protein
VRKLDSNFLLFALIALAAIGTVFLLAALFAALSDDSRASSCAWMPSFSLSGPNCTTANQQVECRCSECFTWGASTGAEWYDIKRSDLALPVRLASQSWADEDGSAHYSPAPTIYCPAKHDAMLPVEGVTYSYTVTAGNDAGVSAPSDTIYYTAAPYQVYP